MRNSVMTWENLAEKFVNSTAADFPLTGEEAAHGAHRSRVYLTTSAVPDVCGPCVRGPRTWHTGTLFSSFASLSCSLHLLSPFTLMESSLPTYLAFILLLVCTLGLSCQGTVQLLSVWVCTTPRSITVSRGIQDPTDDSGLSFFTAEWYCTCI